MFALVHNRYLHDFQVYLVVGLIIRGLIVFKPKLMLAFCLQPVEIARLLRSQIFAAKYITFHLYLIKLENIRPKMKKKNIKCTWLLTY